MTTLAHDYTSTSSSDSSRSMSPNRIDAEAPSQRARWAGRVLSGIGVLFLTFDASMKLLQVQPAIEGTRDLGWEPSAVFGLGVVQAICLALYLVPRTAVLGAILWTGYLGGAIATHVRVDHPLFSHVLFPVYVAAFLWIGLWLREPRLRAITPLTPPQR